LKLCPKYETIKKGLKPAKFHPLMKPTLRAFPEEIRRVIGKAIFDLQRGEKLFMPLSRPMPTVGSNVHELRIKNRDGSWRVFYVTVAEDGIYVFHAFMKKTQKTPKKEIDLEIKRLKEMLIK